MVSGLLSSTKNYYLDAHVHLQDERFQDECDSLLKRAEARGVHQFFCNATRELDWESVAQLASAHQSIIPFWGIHPWFADTVSKGWDRRIRERLERQSGGIGETGLDRVCSVDFDQQIEVFTQQLHCAITVHRPLVIHCIKCWGKLVEILQDQEDDLPPIMVHAFAGSREMMERLVGMGLYLSFSTRLLDPNHKKLTQVFAATPIEHILLETDAPDQLSLFHKAQGARYNEPRWVTDVYARAAAIKCCDLEDLKIQIANNGTVFTDAATLG